MLKPEIEKRFGPYKQPTEKDVERHTELREACLKLAHIIDRVCPESREKASALTELMMVRMFASASVAIHGGE